MYESSQRDRVKLILEVIEKTLIDYNDKLSLLLCKGQQYQELFKDLCELKLATQADLKAKLLGCQHHLDAPDVRDGPSSYQAINDIVRIVKEEYKDDKGIVEVIRNIQAIRSACMNAIKEKIGKQLSIF